jgi:hypothetical protein
MEAQLKPISVPSFHAVIAMFDVVLMSYLLTPASVPKVTNPDEVHEAIMGLKFGRAPDPNGIRNRTLKHLTQRAVYLLMWIFNAILLKNSLEARLSYLHS